MSAEKRSAFLNSPNYQKLISWFLRHPEDAYSIKSEYFLDPLFKTLYDSIIELYDGRHSVTLDEVFVLARNKLETLTFEEVRTIHDSYDDFSNIDFVKKLVRNEWLKHGANKSLLEDTLVNLNQHGEVDLWKLQRAVSEISYNIQKIQSEEKLDTVEHTVERYKEILEIRKDPLRKRTFGFANLDRHLNRPLASGDLSIIFSPRGFGKSNFVLSVIDRLITGQQKVPVFYNSNEMSEESTIDRLICMREDIPLRSLVHPNDAPEDHIVRAHRQLETIKANKLFVPCFDRGMTLDKLDMKLAQAQEQFRRDGVLQSDGYFVAVVDLLTMLGDFYGKAVSAQLYESAVNHLYHILWKHQCAMIGVVQANENTLRSTNFKEIKDVDNYRITLDDIKNSSAIGERARVVFALIRRKAMLREHLPHMEDIWGIREDLVELHCVKQNEGLTFQAQFVFLGNYRIMPYSLDAKKKEFSGRPKRGSMSS